MKKLIFIFLVFFSSMGFADCPRYKDCLTFNTQADSSRFTSIKINSFNGIHIDSVTPPSADTNSSGKASLKAIATPVEHQSEEYPHISFEFRALTQDGRIATASVQCTYMQVAPYPYWDCNQFASAGLDIDFKWSQKGRDATVLAKAS